MSSRIVIDEHEQWVRVTFSKPVLTVETLSELRASLVALADHAATKPVIVASSHPTIFLAGAHLGEISTLDASSSGEYSDRGRSVIAVLDDHPSPTVAAVHGSCSGGGFDLVLACDRIVMSPRSSFSHPGVKRGLVTGWGGTVRLPACIGRSAAGCAFLEGAGLTASDLVEAGLGAMAEGDLMAAATADARRLSHLDPRRLEAWRTIRRGRPGVLWGFLRHGL